MIYPSIDKLLNQVGSKYLLVNIVSKRAHEIEETNHLQLKENEYVSKKPIGRALEEVAKDKIILNKDELLIEEKTEQPIQNNEEKIICPKCGAEMIKRVATKGTNAGNTFYGCSNFPKCRGIINIKN